MFVASQAASFDWNVVAAAVATFVVTGIATAFGFRDGLRKLRQGKTEQVHIAGAHLMDNMSVLMLTEALRENTAIHRECYSCLIEIKTLLHLKMG